MIYLKNIAIIVLLAVIVVAILFLVNQVPKKTNLNDFVDIVRPSNTNTLTIKQNQSTQIQPKKENKSSIQKPKEKLDQL